MCIRSAFTPLACAPHAGVVRAAVLSCRSTQRPDPSTYADCLGIINQLDGAAEAIPASVMARLALGHAGQIPDTAGADHPAFKRNYDGSGGNGGGGGGSAAAAADSSSSFVNNVLVGTNAIAVKAATSKAEHLGYTVVALGSF